MDKRDSDVLHTAKAILLTFKKRDGESLQQAFSVLVEHEKPESLEIACIGGAGLLQWFKFKQLSLLVEKRNGQIIEVREKKF